MSGKNTSIKVLLLEDNPGDALLFRDMLDMVMGEVFAVDHVTEIAEALEYLDGAEVDVVLLDLSLPNGQGLDTFFAVHDEAPHIPIVVLSGSGSEQMAVEAVKAGAQDYLVKGEVTGRLLARSIRYAIERQRVERQTRRQKDLLESTLESLTYPFYVVNVDDYTIEIANSAAAAASRTERPSEQARCYSLAHHRDTPCGGESCPCPLEEVKDTKAPVTVEHVHYDADGNSRIVEVHGYPIFDDEGEVVRMIEYVFDITERKRAKENLRRERDLIARLMDTSPVSITMANRHGELIFANERAEEVLGLNRKEITSRVYNTPDWRITDLDGGPFPDAELPFRRVMAKKEPVYDVRHAIEWPDGQRRILSINGAPLCDEDGEVERVIFAIEDITDQVRAEEERIAQLERELKSLEDIATLPNTAVSARAFGLAPLRESRPNLFDDLVERYERLLDAALEQKAYRVESDSSEEVMAMAERLGALRAGPRDVVDIHVKALKNKSKQANLIKAEAYAEEGRLIALELMGELVSHYRRRCVYILRPEDLGQQDGDEKE
jgi:PAS domain S-box-containing protein